MQEPDLALTASVVHPSIIHAIREASRVLKKLKVSHALAGGLAVGAYGYPHATRNVSFIIGDEAFVHHSNILSFQPGIPVEVNGIQVDVFTDSGIRKPRGHLTMGVPVVSLRVLTYLKVKAFRMQDQLDLIELVRRGADVDEMRSGLSKAAAERFDTLVEKARRGSTSPARKRRY